MGWQNMQKSRSDVCQHVCRIGPHRTLRCDLKATPPSDSCKLGCIDSMDINGYMSPIEMSMGYMYPMQFHLISERVCINTTLRFLATRLCALWFIQPAISVTPESWTIKAACGQFCHNDKQVC